MTYGDQSFMTDDSDDINFLYAENANLRAEIERLREATDQHTLTLLDRVHAAEQKQAQAEAMLDAAGTRRAILATEPDEARWDVVDAPKEPVPDPYLKAYNECPGHEWWLSIADGRIEGFHCAICSGNIDYLYPDGVEFVYGDIPVTVGVEVVKYGATPDHGDEYDVYINVEARAVDDD